MMGKKEAELDRILSSVRDFAESVFAEKLNKVILYGSYARGDFDDESDVDVMIIVDMDEENLRAYENEFTEFSSDMSVENEVLVVPFLCGKAKFDAQTESAPFYRNVNTEGRVVYA
jgi:predicted nucleotidyltransferase